MTHHPVGHAESGEDRDDPFLEEFSAVLKHSAAQPVNMTAVTREARVRRNRGRARRRTFLSSALILLFAVSTGGTSLLGHHQFGPTRGGGHAISVSTFVGKSPTASAIHNPQPWVSGAGSFDQPMDCGAWKTDSTKISGIEFRSCANRTGQIITAGIEVASTDGKNHRVVPHANAWTCVDGPGKCDDLGSANASVNGVLFPSGSAATIGPSSPWTLEVRADVTWGPHRCLGVTASLGGSITVVSPFRLDWNQVKNDANAGTTPEWTCPTPPSFQSKPLRPSDPHPAVPQRVSSAPV